MRPNTPAQDVVKQVPYLCNDEFHHDVKWRVHLLWQGNGSKYRLGLRPSLPVDRGLAESLKISSKLSWLKALFHNTLNGFYPHAGERKRRDLNRVLKGRLESAVQTYTLAELQARKADLTAILEADLRALGLVKKPLSVVAGMSPVKYLLVQTAKTYRFHFNVMSSRRMVVTHAFSVSNTYHKHKVSARLGKMIMAVRGLMKGKSLEEIKVQRPNVVQWVKSQLALGDADFNADKSVLIANLRLHLARAAALEACREGAVDEPLRGEAAAAAVASAAQRAGGSAAASAGSGRLFIPAPAAREPVDLEVLMAEVEGDLELKAAGDQMANLVVKRG